MRNFFLYLLMTLILFAPGCATEDREHIPVESVEIDLPELYMMPGQTYRLTATVLPENASNKKIAWYSSNRNLATIDGDGLVTALDYGEVKITAEANDMHANHEIKLYIDDVDNSIRIEKITFDTENASYNFTLEPDPAPFTVTPSFAPAEATNKKLRWSSDDPYVARVDDAGTVTPVGQGITFIRATATDGGGATAHCEVRVIGVPDALYHGGDPYYGIIYYPVNITVTKDDGQPVTQTWLDRNLGARKVPASMTDHEGYGSLFQWSRKADGHEKTAWTTSTAGSLVNIPASPLNTRTGDRTDAGCNWFLPTNAVPNDWADDPDSNQHGLWGGSYSNQSEAAAPDEPGHLNNPCPAGYRVPTVDEFRHLAMKITGLTEFSFNFTGYTVPGAQALFFDSPLKIPLSGYVNYNEENGNLAHSGRGVYWTNMATSMDNDGYFNNAARFILLADNPRVDNYMRSHGYSVRCIRHTPINDTAAGWR